MKLAFASQVSAADSVSALAERKRVEAFIKSKGGHFAGFEEVWKAADR